MRLFISFILALHLILVPAMADDTGAVKDLVQQKINLVMGLLKDKGAEKELRNEKIVAALMPVLDFDLMAKLSLGKDNWKIFSRDGRKEYMDLFIKQMQDSLLEKLELYTDEELFLKDATQSGKKINVLAELVSKDSKIDLLFKFYLSKGIWKAYDVEILGVSLIQTYRTQFQAIIDKGGEEALLAKMRQAGQFHIETKPGTKK